MPRIPETQQNSNGRAPAGVQTENIPEELKLLDRWTCWQARPDPAHPDRKPSKPPINANVDFAGQHVLASPTDPMTWCSFERAVFYWRNFLRREGALCGLTFALNGDGIVGIDLDKCRNPKTWRIEPWAIAIIERFKTYTEISPSGTGIRLFLRGTLPVDGRRTGPIEVYANKRVLSVTGRQTRLHGAGDKIEDRSEEILAWYAEVFGAAAASTSTGSTSTKGGGVAPSPPIVTLDEGRLAALFAAKPKARAIYEGQWTGYPSQSEAELGLANFARWNGWSREETLAMLVQARWNSGDKDKAPSYFERTVAKAFEGVNGHPVNGDGHAAEPVRGLRIYVASEEEHAEKVHANGEAKPKPSEPEPKASAEPAAEPEPQPEVEPVPPPNLDPPALAHDKDLIGIIKRDIAALGLIGEKDNALLVSVDPSMTQRLYLT
jgi:hypothetical protein